MNENNVVLIEGALHDPQLIEIPPDSFSVAFTALLASVCNLAGRVLTEEQIKLYIDEIRKDIIREFSWMRAGELRFALEQGAKGFFGEVFDVAYPTLVRWIKTYRDSPERAEAVNIYRKNNTKQLPPPPEMTDEDRARARLEHCREMALIAWSIFVGNSPNRMPLNDSRVFMLLPEDAYFFLEAKGMITLTTPQKKEHLARITNMIDTMKKNDEKAAGRIGDSLFSVMAEREKDFYKSCARKFAVAQYFNKLLTSKKEFKP